jgi:rod shape-determining protein MreD
MRANESRLLVYLSLAASLLLMAVPMPLGLSALKPFWTALVLMYWSLEREDAVGLGTAFVIGILLDVLAGTLLGEHALRLLFFCYILTRFRQRLRLFPVWQQALSLFFLLVNDRFVAFWISWLAGGATIGIQHWLAPLAGALLWPWLAWLLNVLRSRQRQQKLAKN